MEILHAVYSETTVGTIPFIDFVLDALQWRIVSKARPCLLGALVRFGGRGDVPLSHQDPCLGLRVANAVFRLPV